MEKIKYICIILLFSLQSCLSDGFRQTQNNEKKYSDMLDSCRYIITINNHERKSVFKYEFINTGCVKIIIPKKTDYNCYWDTVIVCGNLGIIKK